MLTHSDFCTFILSHGRPNNIRTLHPLLNTGNYSGPWYIVIDNEDPTAETYYQLYGSNRVIMFDKEAEARAMKDGPITLWLYESGKDGAHAIIGKCQTKYALPMLQQLDNWQRLWMMREACITEEYLSSYIPCRAWNLTSPVRLPYAVPLSEIGLARPPQSWQYLTEEQAALLR